MEKTLSSNCGLFKVTWFARENTQRGAAWLPTPIVHSCNTIKWQWLLFLFSSTCIKSAIHNTFMNLFTATCFVSDKSMCPSSNLMTDDFTCDVKVNIISIQHQAVAWTSDSLRGEPAVNDKQDPELHKHVWLKQGSFIFFCWGSYRGSTKTCQNSKPF